MSQSTWKDRPCHFTWNLMNAFYQVNYTKMLDNNDYDLKVTRNLLTVGKLLFGAYLEVSNRTCRFINVGKAREFLNEADEYIQNHTASDFQKGYTSVVLLNRLWIEHRDPKNKKLVDSLLEKLNGIELTEKDKCVIGTVKAAALTRYGPYELDEGIKLFEAALCHFQDSPDFLFGALLMTGRKVRLSRKVGAQYNDLSINEKELMDKEKKYCEKLMAVKDEYQLGRSFLGRNLSRRGHCREEARDHLEEAFKEAPDVKATLLNLIKYYTFFNVEKAISILKSNITKLPYSDVAECHFQFALCYMKKDRGKKREQFIGDASHEIDECLKLDKMHLYALMKKVDLLTKKGELEEAKQLFEDKFQQSEDLILDDQFYLWFKYAEFLAKCISPNRIDMWQNVMKKSTQFQYQDQKSGKWEVTDKHKKYKDKAFKTLYQELKNDRLLLGRLYLQNCEFAKAEETLNRLDPTTNVKIPMYLAEIHFKWGCEIEVRSLLKQCRPDEATNSFKMARKNVVTASQMNDFKEALGQKMFADISLWIAHNQLSVGRGINDGCADLQAQSVRPPMDLKKCVYAYRESVRCGSLLACVELMRLIQKGHLKELSTSTLLQILAEIDFCCSRGTSDFLHRDTKPLSFENDVTSGDTDNNLLDMDCEMIKNDIKEFLHRDKFYMDVWNEHFEMESKLFKDKVQNTSNPLMLLNDGGNAQIKSSAIVKAALDCCEKARPLLDHIVVKFQQDELKFSGKERKQYFPLKSDTDRQKLEKELKKALRSTFHIDFTTHYPTLYRYLLEIQPGFNEANEYLLRLSEVVNTSKHTTKDPDKILNEGEDLVDLARKYTDKVEEICNMFFHVMKESSDLKKEVDELVSELKRGVHARADQLVNILLNHKDFVVRMGSTRKLLEIMALVIESREQSGKTRDLEAENKIIEGTWDLSKNLRKSHLAFEVADLKKSDDVLEKCRDTCKEADKLLKAVMRMMKENPEDGNVDGVEFPFLDLPPGVNTDSVIGNTKKKLQKDLKKMGISPKKFLDYMLQMQPCSNDENYKFLAMRKICKSAGTMTEKVNVNKEYTVVEIVRWCIDHAEKTAVEVYALVFPGQLVLPQLEGNQGATV